jgi:signal transduction histidine kinase/CheY-like chemotaxis protein
MYSGLSFYAMQGGLHKTVREDLTVIVGVADRLISSRLNLVKADAQNIANSLQEVSDDALVQRLADSRYERQNFLSLTVFDRNGVIASHGDFQAPSSMLDISKSLQMAFSGYPSVSTTYWNEKGQILLMYVSAPIDKNRVLVASFPEKVFNDLVLDLHLWETGHIFVLDNQGTIVISKEKEFIRERVNFTHLPKEKMFSEDADKLFTKIIQDTSGLGEYSYRDIPRLCGWKKVTGSLRGWTVVATAPLDESPIAKAEHGLVVAGLIFMLIGTFLAIIMAHYISRPLQKIEHQNKELLKLNADFEAANAAKTNFLANVSHEMRTPMSAIIGLSELMLSENEVEGKVRGRLHEVYNAAITLLNIINDILDISKIESGKFELVPVPYDLPSFINNTMTLNVIGIAEKPIEFKLEIDESLPSVVFGDDLRVKQICNNLLSNAFKYTKKGTVEWQVSCQRDGNDIWMTCVMKDTGVGIKPEDLEKLFSSYNQVNTRANRNVEGTGLGLALAKRLVEMMDGTITVQSEYGKGSTFTARFRQGFVTDVPIGAEVVKNLKNRNFTETRLNTKAKFVRMCLPHVKVLVVDDIPVNLDVAVGMLKPYKMQVDCASSGPAAIEAIRDKKVTYDAIFMDHMMPEMDGLEAVRIIRQEIGTEYAKNVPIIAMTANAIVGNEEMFLNNGFQAFIAKPIDIILLDSVIRKIICGKNAEYPPSCNGQSEAAAQQKSSHAHNIPSAQRIPGIDIAQGLERFDGDEELYYDILRSFVGNIPSMLDTLRTVTQEGLPDYAVTVHGVKGASRNIAAENLGSQAEALEHAAKRGDYDFVQANNNALLQAAEALTANITAFLDKKA